MSINRASPEGDYSKCAKEGLAQTSYRGGYQKRPGVPEFCQPKLADCLATLLFPYREVGIKLPTTLRTWQNPGKPGKTIKLRMPGLNYYLFGAKPLLTNRESLSNCQGNEDGLRFWLCGEIVLS